MTETRIKDRVGRPTGEMQRPAFAYVLLLAIVAVYGLHALFISGPEMREAAAAQLARTIAEEDRDVCGQLGIKAGTTQFAICSRELAMVRQKQSDRDHAAADGIL
jgi:hypothetical protein